jgi:hypothetical protein
MSELAVSAGSTQLRRYDPDKGLRSIAVAEAGEKHFARAKDATGLVEAVEAKLELTLTPLPQPNAYAMIRRRAAAAGIATKVGNDSFRATGITA